MPKVIATLKRADGNVEVGEMWHETAIFDSNTPVSEIMDWVNIKLWGKGTSKKWDSNTSANVILSVAQEPKKDESPF